MTANYRKNRELNAFEVWPYQGYENAKNSHNFYGLTFYRRISYKNDSREEKHGKVLDHRNLRKLMSLCTSRNLRN